MITESRRFKRYRKAFHEQRFAYVDFIELVKLSLYSGIPNVEDRILRAWANYKELYVIMDRLSLKMTAAETDPEGLVALSKSLWDVYMELSPELQVLWNEHARLRARSGT